MGGMWGCGGVGVCERDVGVWECGEVVCAVV